MKKWFKAASIRALRTFAQTLLASVTVLPSASLGDINWVEALSIATVATVASFLTSVVSLPESEENDVRS